MSSSHQVSYRISERDYVAAGALFARMTSRHWAVLGVAALIVLVLIVWNPVGIRSAAIGGLIGGVVAGLGVRYGVNPWLLRRHYRQYKAMQEEVTLRLLDEGLHFSSSLGDTRWTWDKLLKWRENEHYILIYPMPRLYHLLPKSVAAAGFDVAALQAALRRHLGAPV